MKLKLSTKAVFIIKDDGPGMSDEVINRIFEPFFTTKKEGTGLGLAISRKIVLDHGGDMRCESSPGKGTTFTITFPLARKRSAPATTDRLKMEAENDPID